jgi:chromosome segregation ATPase
VKKSNEEVSSNSVLALMSKIPDTGSLKRVLVEIEENVNSTKKESKSLNKEYQRFIKDKKKYIEQIDLKQFELSNTQLNYNTIQEDITTIKREIELIQKEDIELDVTLACVSNDLDLVDSERMVLEQTCISLKEKLLARKLEVSNLKNNVEITSSLNKDLLNNKYSFEEEVSSAMKECSRLEGIKDDQNQQLQTTEKELVDVKIKLESSLKENENKEFQINQVERSIDESKQILICIDDEVKEVMSKTRDLDSILHQKVMELNKTRSNSEDLETKRTHFETQESVLNVKISEAIQSKKEIELEVVSITAQNSSSLSIIKNKENELQQLNRVKAEVLKAKNMAENQREELITKKVQLDHEIVKNENSMIEVSADCKRLQTKIAEQKSQIQIKETEVNQLRINLDKMKDEKTLISLSVLKAQKEHTKKSELEKNIIKERNDLQTIENNLKLELADSESSLRSIDLSIEKINEELSFQITKNKSINVLVEKTQKCVALKQEKLDASFAQFEKIEIEISEINSSLSSLNEEQQQQKLSSMIVLKNISSAKENKNNLIKEKLHLNNSLKESATRLDEAELELSASLNDLDLSKKQRSIMLSKINQTELNIESIKSEMDTVDSDILRSQQTYNVHKNDLFDLNKSLLEAQNELVDASASKVNILRNLKISKNEKISSNKKIIELEKSIQFADSESARLLSKNDLVEDAILMDKSLISKLKNELEYLKLDNDSFKAKIETKENELDVEISSQIEIKEKYNKAIALKQELTKQLKKTDSVLEEVKTKNEIFDSKKNDVEKENTELSENFKLTSFEDEKDEKVEKNIETKTQKIEDFRDDLLELSQLLDLTSTDKKLVITQIKKLKKKTGRDLCSRIIDLLRSELMADSMDLQKVQIICTTFGDSKYQLKTFVKCPQEDTQISIDLQKAFKKSFQGKAIYLSRTLEAYQLTCQNFQREKQAQASI